MACFSFFVEKDGCREKIGQAFNPDDADEQRKKYIQSYGEKLVIKVDGEVVNPELSLV